MVWRHRLRWLFINYKPRTAREDPNRRGDDSKTPVGAGFKPAPTNQPTNTHHSPSLKIPPIPVQNPAQTPKTRKSPAGQPNTPQIKAHHSNPAHPSSKSRPSTQNPQITRRPPKHPSNQSPSFQSRPSRFKFPPINPKPATPPQATQTPLKSKSIIPIPPIPVQHPANPPKSANRPLI